MGEIPVWAWITFGAVVAVLFILDLIAHRGNPESRRRRAIIWSCVWVGAGLLFNGFVWHAFGSKAAQAFLASYLIEESLSLDNLFVFLTIFRSLKIPRANHHRVLIYGIIAAVVLRGLFIFLGIFTIR